MKGGETNWANADTVSDKKLREEFEEKQKTLQRMGTKSKYTSNLTIRIRSSLDISFS